MSIFSHLSLSQPGFLFCSHNENHVPHVITHLFFIYFFFFPCFPSLVFHIYTDCTYTELFRVDLQSNWKEKWQVKVAFKERSLRSVLISPMKFCCLCETGLEKQWRHKNETQVYSCCHTLPSLIAKIKETAVYAATRKRRSFTLRLNWAGSRERGRGVIHVCYFSKPFHFVLIFHSMFWYVNSKPCQLPNYH